MLSLSRAGPPLNESASSPVSPVATTSSTALESPNPFFAASWDAAPAGEFHIRSSFIPNQSIGSPEQSCRSPTSKVSSRAHVPPSNAWNGSPSLYDDDSSDDPDFSPDTSPTKSVFTPTKTVTTPTKPVVTPFPSIPSPTQFFSSPSQAVLNQLIPCLDSQSEEGDDLVSTFEFDSSQFNLLLRLFTPLVYILHVLF